MKEYTLNNKHPRVFKLIQKYNEINYEKKYQINYGKDQKK